MAYSRWEDETCAWDLVRQGLASYKCFTLRNGLGIPELHFHWPAGLALRLYELSGGKLEVFL